MKNVSRNKKFLICFRPVDVDLVLDSKAKNKALTYTGAIENQEDMKLPTSQSPVSGIENQKVPSRPRKRRFSQLIKAVVFETALAKRVHNKKTSSYKSKHTFSLNHRNEFLGSSGSLNQISVEDQIQEIKSSSSSSSSSCSCSTTRKQNIIEGNSGQESIKNSIPNQTGLSGLNLSCVMYLLLMSLTVTVFWGRVCAIVFTSICLYFLSQRCISGQGGKLENLSRLPPPGREKSRRDYRNKVIMEGLLERNYRREEH